MKGKILIVDDEADLRELLKSVLESDYAVTTAENAAALQKHFLHEAPDIVLLDLKLPKLSGLDVLKQVRADPRTELLPVVILTSSNEDEDILSCYRSGANSYVRKPVEFERFADAVKQLGCYWLLVNQFPPIALSQSNQTEE